MKPETPILVLTLSFAFAYLMVIFFYYNGKAMIDKFVQFIKRWNDWCDKKIIKSVMRKRK
jgi:predicted PurR-regulated permease PerM